MVRAASCGTSRTSTRRSPWASAAALSLGTTYTAYNSPNSMFTTVKELAFRLASMTPRYLGGAALKPYALFAFEFDTDVGQGQADARRRRRQISRARHRARLRGDRASIAFPSQARTQPRRLLRAERRHGRRPGVEDNAFGYFSVAGIVTVPLGGTTSLGAWNVHGGIEFQALGDTTQVDQRRRQLEGDRLVRHRVQLLGLVRSVYGTETAHEAPGFHDRPAAQSLPCGPVVVMDPRIWTPAVIAGARVYCALANRFHSTCHLSPTGGPVACRVNASRGARRRT